MAYTVVVTKGNDPPGLAYIAPYAATSIAEHFMEAGRDVLIVYDDLTHHTRDYREAFPGDIFHIHSRLLERGPRTCATTSGATRSPRCPLSRRRPRTSRHTSRRTSSPSPTGKFTFRPPCSYSTPEPHNSSFQ